MNRDQILQTPSMPLTAPSYPYGPFRFFNREYLIINYISDPEVIRAALPEPLEPAADEQGKPTNIISYEFMNMPDTQGFGGYNESGLVIPACLNGEAVNFTAQMYLNCEPPVTGGREIWGFPKKIAQPNLTLIHDTLTGTLDYAGERVALGTMGYKHKNLLTGSNSGVAIVQKLGKKQINLKLVPGADGTPAIAQLVSYQMEDIVVKSAWTGPARLHLIPHVNAPVADFPVHRIVEAFHFLADLTLPFGKVEWDYLKQDL